MEKKSIKEGKQQGEKQKRRKGRKERPNHRIYNQGVRFTLRPPRAVGQVLPALRRIALQATNNKPETIAARLRRGFISS